MALAHGLRKEVFVDEQGFSLEADRDEQDKNALHVLGLTKQGRALYRRVCLLTPPGVWHAGAHCRRQRAYAGRAAGCCWWPWRIRRGRRGRTLELGAQYDKQGFTRPLALRRTVNRIWTKVSPCSYAYDAVKAQNGRRWRRRGKAQAKKPMPPPPGAFCARRPWMV